MGDKPQGISVRAVITSARSLADLGAGLNIKTSPLLHMEELAKVLRLQGHECMTVFNPIYNPTEQIYEIDSDLHSKTQSQRIRSVLYVMWEKEGMPGTFAEFYQRRTELIIEWLKSKLEEKRC